LLPHVSTSASSFCVASYLAIFASVPMLVLSYHFILQSSSCLALLKRLCMCRATGVCFPLPQFFDRWNVTGSLVDAQKWYPCGKNIIVVSLTWRWFKYNILRYYFFVELPFLIYILFMNLHTFFLDLKELCVTFYTLLSVSFIQK
jgi:hypothetical protein